MRFLKSKNWKKLKRLTRKLKKLQKTKNEGGNEPMIHGFDDTDKSKVEVVPTGGFMIRRFNVSGIDLEAGGTAQENVSVTVEGYKAISVAGFRNFSDDGVILDGIEGSGASAGSYCPITYLLVNFKNTTQSTKTYSARISVLYVPTEA